METKYDILIQNKRDIQFKFTIRRKFTILRGNSATGKSTLFQMVSDANSSRFSGVTISCNAPIKALYETGYKYEPWHFRYVGNDLASKLYNNGDWLTMEDYFGITSVYSS